MGSTLSVKVITYVENKSSFCLVTTNQKWVLMIELISGDKVKSPIYVIFKGLDIKPAWIELIKNIEGEAKKWESIKISAKK